MERGSEKGVEWKKGWRERETDRERETNKEEELKDGLKEKRWTQRNSLFSSSLKRLGWLMS